MRFICPEVEGMKAAEAIASELVVYNENQTETYQNQTGTWRRALAIRDRARLSQNGFQNANDIPLMGSTAQIDDDLTATAWITGQGIALIDSTPASGLYFKWNAQSAVGVISPYWFTVYDETGIHYLPTYHTGLYRGEIKEDQIRGKTYSPLTVNYEEETGADFTIAADTTVIIPETINSTLKNYAVNKARAMQDIISFNSGLEYNPGEWIQYLTRKYQILSRRTISTPGRANEYIYTAALSSNDQITFTGADVLVNVNQVTLKDGPQLDAFGRLRVSTPNTQFDYHNQYDKGNIAWTEYIVGTGSSTHRPFQSSVLLSTGGTAKYAGIIRQTLDYFRYYPGKSSKSNLSGTLSSATMDANTRSRIGKFDDYNGFFFENNGGTISVVVRDFTGNQYASTPDQFTKQLIHCENVTTETALGSTLTNISVSASSTQKKFGTNSWLFNGSAYITSTIPDSQIGVFDIETSDWTLDFWIYPTTFALGSFVWDSRSNSATTNFRLGFDSTASPNTKLRLLGVAGPLITASAALNLNAWNHVALVKKDGVITLYQGGSSVGTYTDINTVTTGNITHTWGADYQGNSKVSNLTYIDEIRFLKSYAYWTAAFTPPVAAYSDVTGIPTDTKVAQSAWNIDKMDGTGKSGITIDWTKEQIFDIDFEALYAGRVRFSLVIDGKCYVVHEFKNANTSSGPFISNVNLPFRYEIMNTGTASGTMSMLQTCQADFSEGGQESILDHAYTHSVSNGVTAVAVTTRRNVLSLRLKNPFNSLMNRAHIQPISIEGIATTNSAFIEIVYGGVLGGTPSWASAGANSPMEYDIAGTTVTGGEIIQSFYLIAGAGKTTQPGGGNLEFRFPLMLGLHGQPGKVLSIVATAFTGTSNVQACVNMAEIY